MNASLASVIRGAAEEMKPQLLDWYRYLHRFPEMAHHEFQTNAYISTLDEWAFVYETSYEKLKKHFGLDSLKGFGVEGMNLSLTAAGAILYYLENNQQAHCEYFPTRGLSHLCSISRIDSDDFVWLDRFTIRNLELIYPSTADGVSLLGTAAHPLWVGVCSVTGYLCHQNIWRR